MSNTNKDITALEMLEYTQNNLIEVMYDLSNQLNESNDYDKIDIDITTLNSLSTVIDRVGKIIILNNKSKESDNNDYSNDK